MAQHMRGGDNDVFVNLNNTDFSLTHIIFTVFRWCGQIGDTLFIMVSAYFLCDDSKIKLEKAIRMLLDTWLLSVAGLLLAFIWMNPTAKEIIKSFLPVRYSINWFVGCYIIYYLIHPFLNRAVREVEQRTFKSIALVLFVLYSLFGCIQQEYYYTNLVGFICIHYFVSYYKKYCCERKFRAGKDAAPSEKNTHASSTKKNVIAIALSFVAIIVWIIILNFMGKYIGALSDKGLLACTFMNTAIIIIGLSALDLAVHAKPREIKMINAITRYSLLIYLLHGNYFWLTYGKYALIAYVCNMGIPAIGCTMLLIAAYLIATPILSYLYCRLGDSALDKVSNAIAKGLFVKLE